MYDDISYPGVLQLYAKKQLFGRPIPREEEPEGFLVLLLSQTGTQQEEEEGTGDADGDLVEPHDLEPQSLGQTVDDGAPAHGEKGAQLVGAAPEEPQEQGPEEGRFQPAEGEHVDEPDDAGRGQGDEEDQEADEGRGRHGQQPQAAGGGFLPLFCAVVEIDVLDDGGG